MDDNRRKFLKAMGLLGAAASIPASIERALALPAKRVTGTIEDVKHIVILMQENRSFDHYFGTMRGVRGFGDRHTVPLPGGRTIWEQSTGARILTPFHLDTATTSAVKVPDTPHGFPDGHAAWNQGSMGFWPKFKADYSMGYYRRNDIPFQFALAEHFTICDAYHCSMMGPTDPNRIFFWSGSCFDPNERAKGVNCREDKSEPVNLRCAVKGSLPEPGYIYAGSDFDWETIPEVLQRSGIDWRIYQNPNDNWSGLMHGCLAFKGFRRSRPGDPIYERGMRHWSLEQLEQDVLSDTLPAVSWVVPSMDWCEHPGSSTPLEGAEFTARVLDALTANPKVWASTVFLLTFDENDGQFDHLPPPAPPSYNLDGTLAGKATFDLAGEYFDDHNGKYTLPEDRITGSIRNWGLGPRVPTYVVSPWSTGGWVNSETFDHTSVGRFLEKRFGITIPAISPWHRKMCGDLSSCFDFSLEGARKFPSLPRTGGSKALVAEHLKRSKVLPPQLPERPFQEDGMRPSRALPYVLHVDARVENGLVNLRFVNDGAVGATFHVYDKHNLDLIPRRYAVEAGKSLEDQWAPGKDGGFELLVLGHNGFMRSFSGTGRGPLLAISARYGVGKREVLVTLKNAGAQPIDIVVGADAYNMNPDFSLSLATGYEDIVPVSTTGSHGWYDFSVEAEGIRFDFAGRLENGKPGFSDPLMFAPAET